MGFRTVVMLNNDRSHEWANDPKLGEKIRTAMNMGSRAPEVENYGAVVECAHADTQTLVLLDHYTGFTPFAYSSRQSGPTTEEDKIKLLKRSAENMGYRLVKKSTPK
jgi:hypothetical protein